MTDPFPGAWERLESGVWRAPDYVAVFAWRQRRLQLLRDKAMLYGAREYYKHHPKEFINHWCDTYDPRNVAKGMPARLPFVMFKRQEEMVDFIECCRQHEVNGAIDKSRDMGATWDACAYSVQQWCFWDGVSIGWGSRKEQLVDRLGDLDSIFEKIRMLLRGLPRVFLPPGFLDQDLMNYMRIVNPKNGASITGEAGDSIGRGGRKSVYFVDEAAHLEHAESVEASLMENTRVRIDLSSTAGPATVFARKLESGAHWVPGAAPEKTRELIFTMDWSDHPQKTQEWHDQRKQQFTNNGLQHVFAQEVDRDPLAAVDGIVIPGEWVRSAVDAHVRLKLPEDGGWCAGLDVADEGMDLNALVGRRGIMVKLAEEWGERDTAATARRAIEHMRGRGQVDLQYDCIGVGAGIKAEVNNLKSQVDSQGKPLLPKDVWFVPWNAGAEVVGKENHLIPGDRNSPLNGDFFTNFKAQAWWHARRRFEVTHKAVTEPGYRWKADDVVSLDSTMPLLRKLMRELSQATMSKGARMKLVIDKTPDGMRSPNLADACVMCLFPAKSGRPLFISDAVLGRAGNGALAARGVHAP